ncbi:MAG: hypothetical protein IIV48_00150, partial [Clostridium sp.]|nr:hypothetical protein [Clostridium sp.]
EILNPDLHIATVNEAGSLKIDMVVEHGLGYVPAEKKKTQDHTIGVILVDSIFSPIRRVNYKVEDIRVGDAVDYDKLTLEVWTDGSIQPESSLYTCPLLSPVNKIVLQILLTYNLAPVSNLSANKSQGFPSALTPAPNIITVSQFVGRALISKIYLSP